MNERHLLIQGLFSLLPEPDETFTEAQREKWLELALDCFDVIYSEPPQPHQSETKKSKPKKASRLEVEICYPRNDDERVNTIEVGLLDVRAADSIRVSYNFERDGWVIQQASIFVWATDDEVCDAGWQEVAFIRAWALMKEGQ